MALKRHSSTSPRVSMPTSTVFPSSNRFVRDSEALTNNENLPGYNLPAQHGRIERVWTSHRRRVAPKSFSQPHRPGR